MDDFTSSLLTRKPQPSPASGLGGGSSPSGTFEYRILSQRDRLFSGRFNAESLTSVLNQLAAEGWRLVAVTSSGVNTLLGGNRDEILIFLERKPQP